MSALTPDEVGADLDAEAQTDRLDHAFDSYNGSATEQTDALHWIQTADLYTHQTETVVRWYRWSAEHDTAIDDIAEGTRTLP